ncbi:MAG: DUF3099 domain-containing protein [Jiangellaceae bacterium]|nr:DUF3099 domain-containing protein [Jiangellaceae bacterium]
MWHLTAGRAYREEVSSAPRRRDEPVQSVTTARPSHTADIDARQRRYLLIMAVRIICIPPAIIVDGWVRWFFILGAVVLPYIAVVVANAARRQEPGNLVPVDVRPRPALPRAHSAELRNTD